MPEFDAARVVATYEGLEVLEAPHLGRALIQTIKEDRYERGEVVTGLAEVRAEDRVVEMGAGAGIVSGILAKRVRPQRIVSFEANPDLIPHIRALHAHNGVQDIIELRNQIVLAQPNASDTQAFHIRANFLGSGIEIRRGQQQARRIDVPVARWAEVRSDLRPTVILMDIEGAEQAFFRDADLGGVRVVLLELHKAVYGRRGLQEIRGCLTRQGFEKDLEATVGAVAVFRNPTWTPRAAVA